MVLESVPGNSRDQGEITQCPSASRSFKAGHALIIGAGMAGLLAARVLAGHFERISLLERDQLPATSEDRKGVPQGRHVHGLLARGGQLLTRFFPGIVQDLLEAGATPFDVTADFLWHHFGAYKVRHKTGMVGLSLSRALLESTVRARVLSLQNINCLQGIAVQGLIPGPDQCVAGVKLVRQANGDLRDEIRADLTIDASGRGSQSPVWLEQLGYGRVPQEEIGINVGYTSRIYERKPEDLGGALVAITHPTPPNEKGMGAMFPIEGNRWLVTLGGWLGNHVQPNETDYLAFARSLPTTDIYNVISRATPLSDFAVYKVPSNLRRLFHKMPTIPERYLAVGDAICSFNPVYGQGMTVSALEAEMLAVCIEAQAASGTLDGLSSRFFKQAARVVDTPWALAGGEDLRYPDVTGTRSIRTRLTNWYVEKVHRAAMHDPAVVQQFLRVTNMIDPPYSLLWPRMTARVLVGSRRSAVKKPACKVFGEAAQDQKPRPTARF